MVRGEVTPQIFYAFPLLSHTVYIPLVTR